MAVQFSAGNGFQGGPTKVTDAKTFTCSLWFKTPATLATQALMNWHRAGEATSHGITVVSDGTLTLTGRNGAGTLVLDSSTDSAVFAASTWYNVLIEVDMAAATPVLVYVNGTAAAVTNATATNAAIDWSVDHLTLGAARDAADDRASEFTGIIDEIYWTTTNIDLSTAANRGLFYGASGEQVGLGHQARTPLDGTRPIYFFTHGPGNFGRNEGSGIELDTVGTPTGDHGRPASVETLARGFKGEEWRESERSGIPFPESELVFEPASGLEVAAREFSTDRDEINRRRRFGSSIFEY